MSGIRIEDGTGSGHQAKVGRRGHLFTLALDFPIAGFFAGEGDSYYMPTDFISYTTVDTEQLLAFIQNTREAPFYLSKILLSSDVEFRMKMYKGPTSVASGVAVTPVNTNFDSGKNFQGTFEKGAEGATITNGEFMASLLSLGGDTNFPTNEVIILGQGKKIALSAEVAAAGDVSATVWGHYFA